MVVESTAQNIDPILMHPTLDNLQMLKPASDLVARMNTWLDSKRAVAAAARPS
jgi:hypothetical protein